MSVVGLDFGSVNTLIAAAGRGGVDVILNGNSNRMNPNMVTFDLCRFMGENASSKNYKNTINNMKRLIGLTYEDPRAQAEMKLLNYTCVPIRRNGMNSIGVKVSYNNEEKIIPIEAVAGMIVKHMGGIAARKAAETSKDTAPASSVPITSISHPLFPQNWVIAVPGYYTDAQRRALLTGCEVVGVQGILRLMNETTATALAYGIFKDIKKEFTKENPTNVMFIDIGASAYSVSIATFEPGKLIVKSTQYDPDLGGRDFDYAIASWIAKNFVAKYKNKVSMPPMDNPKARLKLLAAAEKAKKTLSPAGVRETNINIEYLQDDLDFNIKLTAKEFESMVSPLLDRLIAPLQRAFDETKLDVSKLSSVEIVGGGSRVGCVKRTLSSYLKLNASATNYGLSSTMNADEAVCRGAALQSAILSPRFRVAAYEIIEYQPFPILVSWEGDSNSQIEDTHDTEQSVTPNSVIMFDRGSNFPLVRRVTLKRSGEFNVAVSYDEIAEEYGLTMDATIPANIATFKIKAPIGNENKVRVNVKQDIHGIITLSSAQMVEEIEEPPTDTPMEEKQEPPAEEKKKKIKKTNLEYVIVRPLEWSKAEFDGTYESEVAMDNHDRIVKETSDMRNELETYIYGMRDRISSTTHLAQYCTDEERSLFSEKLETIENWLYEDGFDATKSVYSQKLDELKALGDPINNRYYQAQHRPNAISGLQRNIEKYKNWLNTTANEDKYAHISDEEKLKCHEKCDEISSWMYEMLDKQGSLPASSDPIVTIIQIQEKVKELSDALNPIVNKPAPKPKPEVTEEKKKEETSTPPADGEKEAATPMDAENTEVKPEEMDTST